MKPLVIRSAIVASVGGLIFGFDTAVISGGESAIQDHFHLSSSGIGFVVATALLGTILGAATAGRFADRHGRKPVLFVIGALYVIGALGSALATHEVMLEIFRFLGGIGVGASSVVAPIYTAEVAPPANRGRLVGLVQFNIVLGILIAYASNAIIQGIVTNADVSWRWMFGVMAVPALVFLALLPTVPETPRWLLAHGQEQRAVETSERLCLTHEESERQLAEVREQLAEAAQAENTPFFTRQNRRVILLAIAIAFFNQMSGINAILYYAPKVMEKAGASTHAAFLMSVAVGAMNLIATMAALTVIDRFGRRRLMLVGSVGYLVSLGFLSGLMFFYERSRGGHFTTTSSVLVLVGLMVFIAAHAFGQGAVIWVFISEIFPNRIRGRGQSLGSLTHWIMAAVTTYAFPPVIDHFGGGPAFLIFFVAMIGQLFWVTRVMPETKGIPLEEMEARLGLTAS